MAYTYTGTVGESVTWKSGTFYQRPDGGASLNTQYKGVSSGSLPPGLSFSYSYTGNGVVRNYFAVIQGKPTAAGHYTCTCRVTWQGVGTYTFDYDITIQEKLYVTTSSLSVGRTGKSYDIKIEATGTKPITWSITKGELPPGLNLNAETGVISGVLE